MKNKKTIYILLPAALGIWGYVFYEFFSFVGSKEVVQAGNVAYSSMLPVKTAMDTFSIVADYRDPFLGKIAIASSENDKPKNIVKKIEKPTEPVKWPSIIYRGMIKNQKTNKQLYLVSIDKQDNMMKPGDFVADVELKKVYRDSIEVVYRKGIKVFRK